jgi:hypothetical protein
MAGAMSKQSKSERLAGVHQRARIEFDAIQMAVRDERMQCLSDRRFMSITGAQWEGPLGYQFENKPKFEFNKTHLAVIRVVNEYRNNRITVDFISKDGTENDRMADACDGLYRADEQASGALEAYDNCYEEGVSGGMGALRYRACYEDDDDDEDTRQRIRIEPIFDADSTVFFDLQAKRQDKADAKRCWVLNSYTRGAYLDEFGDDPSTWPKDIQQGYFDWCTADVVWVAEYYEVEKKTELIHFFRGLDEEADDMEVPDSELQDEPDKLDTLLATGFREVRQKRVKRSVVHKYIMSGSKILEDCGIIAGKCIPIVPFYGKRWYVDGVERCMGHVRLARDAQMLNNMLMSWLAEMAARFDIEKPILTPEQISGHALMWAEDNVKRFPYLLINQMTDAGGQPMPAMPVAYTKAPNVPPAVAALMQMAIQALDDLLGNQQAGEQIEPNLSGKAVELIQQRLDMQVFIYMSNFAKTIQRGGEVWLSMAKDLLVEPGRKMKTISSDGKPSSIELLRPMVDEDTGAEYLENDMSAAKFDVVADVGPSSSSRRSATVRALTGIISITEDPETRMALSIATIANLEGEGLSDLRDWARARGVKMGVMKPTDEEKKQLEAEVANQQPDPNVEFLKAESAKALADADATQAKIGLTHAQTIETLAGIDSARQADAIALAQALTPDAPPAGAEQQQAAPQQ